MKRDGQQRLTIVPISYSRAASFVDAVHRHHRRPTGQKFAVGVVDEAGVLRGVAMCGRPIARALDDGFTLEVVRTCTDGCPNANGALYGAAWRVARALGYTRATTDTEEGESGASLRAAGWVPDEMRRARGSWAESSVALRDRRDPVGSGGVRRRRWWIYSARTDAERSALGNTRVCNVTKAG